jgi:hypothetical protein
VPGEAGPAIATEGSFSSNVVCYIDVKRDIRDAEGRRGVDVDSDRVSSKTSAVRRELLERKKKKSFPRDNGDGKDWEKAER